jgi:hypothetical protein
MSYFDATKSAEIMHRIRGDTHELQGQTLTMPFELVRRVYKTSGRNL